MHQMKGYLLHYFLFLWLLCCREVCSLGNPNLYHSYHFEDYVSFRQSSKGLLSGAESCSLQNVGKDRSVSYFKAGILALRLDDGVIFADFQLAKKGRNDIAAMHTKISFGRVDAVDAVFNWEQPMSHNSRYFQRVRGSHHYGLQLSLNNLTDSSNVHHVFDQPGDYFLAVGLIMSSPNGTMLTLDCSRVKFYLKNISFPVVDSSKAFNWTAFRQVKFNEIRAHRLNKPSSSRMLGASRCILVSNSKVSRSSVVRNGLVAVQTDGPFINGYTELIVNTFEDLYHTKISFALGQPDGKYVMKQRVVKESDSVKVLSIEPGAQLLVYIAWQVNYSDLTMTNGSRLIIDPTQTYVFEFAVKAPTKQYGCYSFRGLSLNGPDRKIYRPVIEPPSSHTLFDWGQRDSNFTRYSTPALFHVLDVLAIEPEASRPTLTGGSEIGPFSFTVGETPSNSIFSAAFEPMSFRYRFSALPGSSGDIVLADTSIVSQYAGGLFDGAEASVFRLVNGDISVVRVSQVLRDVASGWEHVFLPDEGYLFSPTVREIAMRLPYYHAYPSANWFKVVAMTSDGEESDGPAASLWLVYANNGEGVVYDVQSVTVPRPIIHFGFVSSNVTAPTNLTAHQDLVTGKIVLAWNFDDEAATDAGFDIIGFRVYRSDTDPTTHEGWFLELENDGGVSILPSDLVFLDHSMRSWSRLKYANKRVFGTEQGTNPPLSPYFMNDETNGTRSWEYVQHPAPVPSRLAYEGGKTCIKVECTDNSEMDIRYAAYGSTNQHYYPVLMGNTTYVVEGWFRAGPGEQVEMSFTLDLLYDRPDLFPCVAAMEVSFPWVFSFGDSWEFHQLNFTITDGCIFTGPGASGTGQAVWAWRGPNTVFMDNLRMYDQSGAFGDWMPADYEELKISKMEYVRTHMFIKSSFSYSMDSLTDVAGNLAQWGNVRASVWTLHSLLSSTAKAGIKPWIQLELCMTDSEWLGFVEFMCASYDPNVDTPLSKPWAHKRYARGVQTPWLEQFPKILFELSNENWNYMFFPWTFTGVSMVDEVTGTRVSDAVLYGFFQERVIQLMKSSPYWSAEAEEKFVFVIGGWAAQNSDVNGYGQLASQFSPSSSLLTIAGYNGGWERGQASTDSREGFLSALMLNAVILNNEADRLTRTQAEMREMGVDVMLGTYEAGPGYNLNGLNGVMFTPEQVESESLVLKSQAGGVATLETFLYRARLGWALQNFFTFDRNRYYWVSHARAIGGGYAYPPWSALTMYNKHAVGSFLLVNRVSSPISDFEGFDDVPLVVVYATKSTDGSRYSVFVISRKLDYYPFEKDAGMSNVSLALPFRSAASIKLVKMDSATGPTTTTLDSNAVVVEEEILDSSDPLLLSPVFQITMPPGAAYLYVFSGVQHWDLPTQQTVLIAPVRGVVEYPDLAARFRVVFDRPVQSFSAADVSVSGTAGATADGLSIISEEWSKNSAFIVAVSNMRESGSVVISVGSVSSMVSYIVHPAVPTSPVNLQVIVNANATQAKFQWEVIADIAQYTTNYILHWGDSPQDIDRYSTGVMSVDDLCPRCFSCTFDPSAFCSTASFTLDISELYSTNFVRYQQQYPVYFQLQAVTPAGLSSPALINVFNVLEYFDLPVIGPGIWPDAWICESNCADIDTLHGTNTTLISPSNSPLLRFLQSGGTSLTYKQMSTGLLDSNLTHFKFYTVSMQFGFHMPRGASEIGVLAHLSDAQNWILVFVSPATATFRILGRRNNSPIYAATIGLVDLSPPVSGDGTRVWTLTVQVRPSNLYCGAAQEVLVEIRDEQGQCQIDFDSIEGSEYQVSSCVLGFSDCRFDGLAGSFGIYSNNAQSVGGHYIDSFTISARGVL